jgi:hypothetical protein
MDITQEPEDSGKAIATMWLGTAIFLIGLLLPLFHARFQPPGGFQTLSGHRFSAFNFQATGFQFARAAPSSRIWILIFLLLVVLGVRTLLYLVKGQWTAESSGTGAANHLHRSVTVAKGIQAIIASIVALGWLVVLSLLILLSHTPIVRPAIPADGAKGILATFQHPLTPGPTFETPYLVLSLGVGMLFLIVGIAICLFSVGKVAGAACIVYIVTAVVLVIAQHVFHNNAVDDILHAIRTHLLLT